MANNEIIDPRRYSNTTYLNILGDLEKILKEQQGPLADTSPGSYGRTLMEMFAASGDLWNYWINRAFEDSNLDTAKKEEAAYIGARSLGYSVRRPTPSLASFGIRVLRTGRRRTINVEIKKGTTFTAGDVNLIASDNVKFTITPDRANPNEDGVMSVIKKSDGFGRNVLIEGELKKKTFFSNDSSFQEFIIDDASFSDWFGDRDPNYKEPDERRYRDNRFTTVTTDIGLAEDDGASQISTHGEKLYWRISRRGFNDPNLNVRQNELELFESKKTSLTNFTCLMTTANDGNVKLEFHDGLSAAIPKGIIEVTYLSTSGAEGRRNNVFDTPLQISNEANVLITDERGRESDITIQDLDIRLLSDVQGGLGIESIQSIKKNASSVYSTFDTLSTHNSYVTFLKTRFGLKYARAVGEDEINKFKDLRSNIKYVNVVRYTGLKDLYEEVNGNIFLVDERDYQVSGFKVPGLTYLWEFDYEKYTNDRNSTLSNVNTSIFRTHIDPKYYIKTGSELQLIHNTLDTRGLLTVEHAYIPPFVHHFDAKISLILREGASFTDIKEQIIQEIYSYLKDFTDFSKPIYKSKITKIIEDFPEVSGTNIQFVPEDNEFNSLNLNELRWFTPQTNPFITNSLKEDAITMDFQYTNADSEGKVVSVTLPAQISSSNSMNDRIADFITGNVNINSDGIISDNNLSADVINSISGYIWSQALNEILLSIDNYLKKEVSKESEEYNEILDLIYDLRTWEFNDNYSTNADRITFDDAIVKSINSLQETSGNLFRYFSYALEYIKLVRNILRYHSSKFIIDDEDCGNGDLVNFSTDHEIIQLRVIPENITIEVESSSRTNKKKNLSE